MNIGMMWFDNDKQTALDDKVSKAAEYYQRKYGGVPNLCLVHPSMLPAGAEAAAETSRKVIVRAHRLIQPGNFWIGMEEKNQ